MLELGIMYRDGIGVTKNVDEAINWFNKAADYGNTKAMLELSNIYKVFYDDNCRSDADELEEYKQACKKYDNLEIAQNNVIEKNNQANCWLASVNSWWNESLGWGKKAIVNSNKATYWNIKATEGE